LPPWLSDYTQALIGRANQAAGLPYEAYSGPRIAGFTGDQKRAQDMIRNSVGNWTSGIDTAKGLVNSAGNVDPLAMAAPHLATASRTFPGAATEYMNPYIDNVVNRSRDVAMRNWDENLLPSIQAMFTAGGQYGSTRMADKVLQGARGVTENIQSQADAALADAYTNAGQMFSSDAGRAANLAGTTGNLALAGGELDLAAAREQGALAEMIQQLGLREAGALDAVGAQQQQLGQANLDLAYQDFERQRDYPMEQVGWLSDIIRGTPHATTTSTTQTGPLGNQYQPSGISQIGSAASGIKGLWELWKDMSGNAKGGRVPKYARGGALDLVIPRYAHG
jgi:hypothetical protein